MTMHQIIQAATHHTPAGRLKRYYGGSHGSSYRAGSSFNHRPTIVTSLGDAR